MRALASSPVGGPLLDRVPQSPRSCRSDLLIMNLGVLGFLLLHFTVTLAPSFLESFQTTYLDQILILGLPLGTCEPQRMPQSTKDV